MKYEVWDSLAVHVLQEAQERFEELAARLGNKAEPSKDEAAICFKKRRGLYKSCPSKIDRNHC